MKKKLFPIALALTPIALAIFIYGCGSSDVNDISGDHPATTVAAAVGGAIAGVDGGGATTYYEVRKNYRLLELGKDYFGIPEAEAAACGLANETCTAGVVTVVYNGCTSKNGRTTFTGGYTLTLGGAVTACPGSGFWVNFFTTPGATLFKTFSANTSHSNVDGVSVTANNTNPTGWDTAVTLTKNTTYSAFGLLRTSVSKSTTGSVTTSNQTLFQSGVQHVASGKKKGVAATLWDHTISMAGAGLNVTHTYDKTAGTDTKVVSSADPSSVVIVQHNLAKWTGRATMTNVTYVHGTDKYCGCYPISGTINAVHSGSKTSAEQLKFTYATTNVCGSYDIQTCSDNTCATLTGTVTSGVLNHCL